MSNAQDCIEEIRLQGDVGYVKGTTLFGPCFIGLKASAAGRVLITDLWVSPTQRNEGHGQRMLDTCMDYADLYRVTLQVRPCAFDRAPGDMTTKKLRAWYARNLFCTVDGSKLMRRVPLATQGEDPI